MSNLQLPVMSYENLSTLKVGKTGKIGYATHIDQDDKAVTVFHHGHPIALLTPNCIELNNRGYHTRTTADRLHRIATANGAGGVRMRNGIMQFVNNDGEIRDMFGSVIAWRD